MRDRLAELNQISNELTTSESNPNQNNNDAAVIEMQPVPTVANEKKDYLSSEDMETTQISNRVLSEFFAKVTTIRTELRALEVKINNVNEKHELALATVSQKQLKEIQNLVDDLMSEIQTIGRDLRSQVQDLESFYKSRQSQTDASTMKIMTNQRDTLIVKFMSLMANYNQIQQQYKKRCKERILRQLKTAKPEVTDEEIESVVNQNQEPPAIFAQEFLDTHTQARAALEDIQARHFDITRLEQSLVELNSLYNDMYLLVNSQDSIISAIDSEVTRTDLIIGSGAKVELKKAERIHRKILRKKRWIFSFSTIIIIIIVLAIVLPLVL